MNLECKQPKEPLKLICHKCGYVFYSKARARGTTCSKCRSWILIPANASKKPANANIKDDIMQGNIMDALNKANINPMNHSELIKDAIPIILKYDKLKFAFAEYCQEVGCSPQKAIRDFVKYCLKEKGKYE